MNRRSSFLVVWAFLIYAILYLPIFVMCVNSFNLSKYPSRWDGFTFKWYQSLLQEEEVLLSLWNSLVVGGTATLVAVLSIKVVFCGTLRVSSASLVRRMKIRRRKI